MPKLIERPVRFPQENIAIDEFVGRISNGDTRVSVCRITSGEGWSEPAQQPEFDEYTVVVGGALYIKDAKGDVTVVRPGQAVLVESGERIQYSSPEPCGADYIAICLPAFKLELANRDPE